MTALQRVLIALSLSAALGAGTYEAHRAARWREQVRALQHMQAPLLGQIRQARAERDAATNQLAVLLAQNERLKSTSNMPEILDLRTELSRLESEAAQGTNDPEQSAMNSWLARVEQLKEYAAQHPGECIPEFRFLTPREWLLMAAPGVTGSDWAEAVQGLKAQAVPRFAEFVEKALQKYAQANDGQFPSVVSQLKAYCDQTVADILQQRYEIKPASVLPASSVKEFNIVTDWVIAGRDQLRSNSANHVAIYTNGYTYFW